jgi:hypothetical protein
MGALNASSIYAGIHLARRGQLATADARSTVFDLSAGPADEASFDYVGARLLTLQFGDAFFSAQSEYVAAFRETLKNFVLLGGSGWPELLPAGRKVLVRSLTPNERQCFEIARLLEGNDADIIAWWDNCSDSVRSRRTDSAANDGRDAERMSLNLELDILTDTPLEPVWVAIEDNGFGCDIQTFRPGVGGWSTPREHFIEVKSSIGRQRFFISRNEWLFARRHSDSWELQFWDLRTHIVKSLSFEDLENHMPKNHGSGQWTTAMISMEHLDA